MKLCHSQGFQANEIKAMAKVPLFYFGAVYWFDWLLVKPQDTFDA